MDARGVQRRDDRSGNRLASSAHWAARTVLSWTSAVTLLDSVTGFFFHVRGIARKPGGWRLPVANIVMGPPIFAPLLFGVSAYLGLIASFLRPEEAPEIDLSDGIGRGLLDLLSKTEVGPWRSESSRWAAFKSISRSRRCWARFSAASRRSIRTTKITSV